MYPRLWRASRGIRQKMFYITDYPISVQVKKLPITEKWGLLHEPEIGWFPYCREHENNWDWFKLCSCTAPPEIWKKVFFLDNIEKYTTS